MVQYPMHAAAVAASRRTGTPPPPRPSRSSLLLFVVFTAAAALAIFSPSPLFAAATATPSAGGSSLFVSSSGYSLPSALRVKGVDIGLTLETLLTRVSSISSELNQTKSDLAAVSDALRSTQTELIHTQTELGSVRDELVQTKAELSQTKADLSAAQETIARLNNNVTAAVQRLTLVETAVDAVESKVDATETKVSNAETLKTGSSPLVTAVLGSQAAITSISNEVSKTKANLSVAQGDIAVLNSNVTAAAQRITSVESNVVAVESKMSAAETKISNLEALAPGSSALVTTVLSSQSAISTLNTDLSQTKTDLGVAKNSIVTLGGDVTAAVQRITTVEGKVTTAETKISYAETLKAGSSALVTAVLKSDAALSLQGSSALVVSANASAAAVANMAQQTPGFRNRLVNGDFTVDSFFYIAIYVPQTYLREYIDGWYGQYTMTADKMQLNRQSSNAFMGGHRYFVQVAVYTDPTPVNADDFGIMMQTIPFGSVRDLAFGSPAAATLTLSFWVRGTPGRRDGALRAVGGKRSIAFSFYVTSPQNIFSFVSITLPGDTCAACWNNGIAPAWDAPFFELAFATRAGTNKQCSAGKVWLNEDCYALAGTGQMGMSATQLLSFAGVQLERGNTATPFDIRPYGFELQPAGTQEAISSIGSNGGMKNRIINGAFNINQLQRGAAKLITASDWIIDRWRMEISGTEAASMFSVQQNGNIGTGAGQVIPPIGFSSFLQIKVVKTISNDPASATVAYIRQSIERSQLLDFMFQKREGKAMTLSFYVRAPVAGVYSGALRMKQVIGTYNRMYVFNYTVSTADTWQRVLVSMPPDNDNGGFVSDFFMPTTGVDQTTAGMDVILNLLQGLSKQAPDAQTNIWYTQNKMGVLGQANIAHSNLTDAAMYFTAVQLERSPYFTGFDARPPSEELQLVQRYVYAAGFGQSTRPDSIVLATRLPDDDDAVHFQLPLPVPMRAKPTLLSSLGNCVVVRSIPSINPGTSTPQTVSGFSWSLSASTASNTDSGVGAVLLTGAKPSHGLSYGAALQCPTTNDGFIFLAESSLSALV